MSTFEQMLARMLWGQMYSLGWFHEPESTMSRLTATSGLQPLYTQWLEESLAVLERHGYIQTGEEGRIRVLQQERPDSSLLWQEWDRDKQPFLSDSNTRQQVILVETTLRALPDILTGKAAATDILFPDSSMRLLEGIYKHNEVADYFNLVTAQSAAAFIEARIQQDPEAKLRLLEIGAGTGGTSETMFRELKPWEPYISEYCYTDISKAFLMHAEREYGPGVPYLTYQLFNVEMPLAKQKMEYGGYDLVIATNVLHATRNIRRTIRNAKAALKANGLIIINEMSQNMLFTHLTFGLLEGWWLYEDPELRIPGCPGLDPAAWESVLREEGFCDVYFPVREAHDLGQQIIIGESDGVIRQDQQEQQEQQEQQAGSGAVRSEKLKEEAEPIASKGEAVSIAPREKNAAAASPSSGREGTRAIPGDSLEQELLEKSMWHIKRLVGETLQIAPGQIDVTEPLEQYGIDSILVVQLTNDFRKVFTGISSTLFFEYQTVEALTRYFLHHQREALLALTGLQEQPALDEHVDEPVMKLSERSQPQKEVEGSGKQAAARPYPIVERKRSSADEAGATPRAASPAEQTRDVAIIGLSGRYPGAENVNQFWEKLRGGVNCITEIPQERWDWRKYFDSRKGRSGSIYTKWGGFLTDIDAFDSLFFHISPAEAERMDPQERLFIETVYACMEDAGYTPAALGNRKRIGVFAGVMNGNYASGPLYYSIANRVSYLFNFQGPSLAVDTACSSSLTAIHLALESLTNGTCEVAIAGGVNLIVDPVHYVKLSEVTMLSEGDQCRSFGAGADGFVDSEGVGAVLLKPLHRAVEDRDHIYGVIKGSMLNAGGKTHGYSVPNPSAQADVIAEALQRSGVHARTISYVEAHGTGTALGDPIEIAGLTHAFGKDTEDKQYCAIGSVKSNIGHCESAAGMAGLTKVLMQMKHGELAPTLHAAKLNPEIDFNRTPFVVQQSASTWERPIVTINGEPVQCPRRAGISSFGAGGANAHLVVEEYITPDGLEAWGQDRSKGPFLFVLSAKTKERLLARARQLLEAAANGGLTDSMLGDAAYTLQVGREPMEERFACIADSASELQRKLSAYAAGEPEQEEVFLGTVRRGKDSVHAFAVDEDLQEAVNNWIRRGKFSRLLELWVQGLALDWSKLYHDVQPNRISLPTYPFAKDRYWWTGEEWKAGAVRTNAAGNQLLHPLVHLNRSTFAQQQFCSEFTGEEPYLSDHVLQGSPMLSGAACLEMARAAIALSLGASGPELMEGTLSMQHIAWIQPIVADGAKAEVQIRLQPAEDGQIAFEICRDGNREDSEGLILYCQGQAQWHAKGTEHIEEIASLRAGAARHMTAEACYEVFQSAGIQYGSSHQCIEEIRSGSDYCVARLKAPAGEAGLVLIPGLLDAAFQSVIGLTALSAQEEPSVPFSLEFIEIRDRCAQDMWAVVRVQQDQHADKKLKRYDINICNAEGRVIVVMRGFTSRKLAQNQNPPGRLGLLLASPFWEAASAHERGMVSQKPSYKEHLLLVCGSPSILQAAEHMSGVRMIGHSEHRGEKLEAVFYQDACALVKELQAVQARPDSKVLIQVVVEAQGNSEAMNGLYGLLQTAQMENPNVVTQLIELLPDRSGRLLAAEELADCLWNESCTPHHGRIRYDGQERMLLKWEELAAAPAAGMNAPWKEQGVYVITGGAGGLGLTFAGSIAKQLREGVVVLVGRSPLSTDKQEALARLSSGGVRMVYKQADVSSEEEVTTLVSSLVREFGTLTGILHGAGVVRDSYVRKKKPEEIREVFHPKVNATVYLDEATAALPLDFFVGFSSGAALGNPGQADYAAANSFMDAYAAYRNRLVDAGQRQGVSLSINWPLWQSGGMGVDEETEAQMLRNTGMVAMPPEIGLDAFYQALEAGSPQVLVAYGQVERLRSVFTSEPAPIVLPEETNATISQGEASAGELAVSGDQAAAYLKELLSSVIKLPASRIKDDAPFEEYGIDSIMVIKLTNKLEEVFGSLSKTLFFEYQTMRELTAYFQTYYNERMQELLGVSVQAAVNPAASEASSIKQKGTGAQRTTIRSYRSLSPVQHQVPKLGKENESPDIAIIGIAGRYPDAKNLREFWDNLKQGKDSIKEIPSNRWDHVQFFDEDKNKPGKTYTKWGGFLDGVDQFDPLFFNISPREAEVMDPQERLFLQTVYEAVEDAGYRRDSLAGSGAEVGVYVGVMYQEYQLYGAEETLKGRPMALSGNPSSIANRVSYFFNFKGPSLAVDTMCSSSLTAIHLACQSLMQGECQIAVAGGVNLSLHPNKYLALGQGKFASSKGRCHSFGADGDGYVPGEGVGAVLLKPLWQAEEDGDHIYGVIKGTSINHGGKTNGYTVPNPHAQSSVIGKAFKKAGIDPATISYIEAHGTGTSLGDPIEITGLSHSFGTSVQKQQYCAIGSVKSNIGHCESAAGIAGLTKVLLQMKHKQLVPSLHADHLNPNINFEQTPFYVQRELTEWRRPAVEEKGTARETPRRAGISAFGAGGSNAHLIVEEYMPSRASEAPPGSSFMPPAIIVLSAKEEHQLHTQAARLLDALQAELYSEASLEDIAFTLQEGREAMEERLAFAVHSMEELETKLQQIVAGERAEGMFRGGHSRDAHEVLLLDDEDLKAMADVWISKQRYDKLMDVWVKGLQMDWSKLYPGAKPRRISLPTYPFATERYWVPGSSNLAVEHLDKHRLASEYPKTDSCSRLDTRPQVYNYRFLRKGWQASAVISARLDNGKVAILCSGETRELAERVQRLLADAEIILTDDGLNLGDEAHQWAAFKGCIDLAGCDARVDAAERMDWLVWLQHWIEEGSRDGLVLLGVTSGLEALGSGRPNSINGAVRAALYRMLQSEYKHVRSRHLDIESASGDAAEWIVKEYLSDSREPEVSYRLGERYTAILEEAQGYEDARPFTFPEGKVLLVTGGTRGLGLLTARHFVEHYGVTRVVLTGREMLPPADEWEGIIRTQPAGSLTKKLQNIQALRAMGAEVRTASVALHDREEMRSFIREIRAQWGPIGGVIHCAGLTDKDNPAFIRKSVQSIRSILTPKVEGLRILAEELADEPPSFMLLYSSVSAIIPELAVGQSDYAMANAYMDYWASALRSTYPVISIQWPNWSEAGMGEVKSPAYIETGLRSHTNREGLMLLDRILSHPVHPVIMPAVIDPEGWNPAKLLRSAERALHKAQAEAPARTIATLEPRSAGHADAATVERWVTSLLADQLKLGAEKIKRDVPFQDYGMDSILLAQVLVQLDRELGGVSVDPTILLEYPTVRSLSEHIYQTYRSEVDAAVYRGTEAAVPPVPASGQASEASYQSSDRAQEAPVNRHEPESSQNAAQEPKVINVNAPVRAVQSGKPPGSAKIAIIGMSCHFPDARDTAEFWNNLRSGRDSIGEVPRSRWDWQASYSKNGEGKNRIISKWGGFLSDIELFDPEYFNISESLAVQLDPLQRQWLEVSVEAMADAGYAKKDLWGRQVGVFVGARTGRFAQRLPESRGDTIIGTAQNFIGAHLAHICNFKGPNMVVDTACSSSLSAIHLAVRSIQSGESELALAGGVDILEESVYLALSKAKVLSPDGRCKTFSADADGIGIGEGCGVVLLKRLEDAIADNDKIYGVIDGSALNNDGNTMGVTTPNPEAQQELIERAIQDANIDPATIGYVETHGTGTLIGDPLELKGLTRIFEKATGRRQFCGVGSVKSNIGHLLSAAGAASVIKVLLSIIHGELPPTLHCSNPNPRFQFGSSPLYPVQQLTKWSGEHGVRRAGISSFGLGGNNAHLIISNEGIPDACKASLISRGEPVIFRKRRYWPENQPEKELLTADPFEAYFEFDKVDGR